MGRNPKPRPLAESVATAAERAGITRMGCDFVKGCGVVRPMPLAEGFGWLAQDRSDLPRAAGQNG